MKKRRLSDAQIVGVWQEQERGAKVADRCRTHGLTEQTFAPLLSLEAEVGEDPTVTLVANSL